MAESYCGKSCKACPQKQQSLCPGCRTGPGRKFGGDCKLAACVHEKGHETCETCGFHVSCARFHGRHQVPEQRRIAIEEEAVRRSCIRQRAQVLGKWLWILFWLIVPSNIGSLLASDLTKDSIPMLYSAGEVIRFVCNLVYGAILLKLAPEEAGYRKAGICILVSVISTRAAALFTDNAGLTLLITVPMAIVSIYGQYHEYMTHGAVAEDVDYDLSQNWVKLWKWDVAMTVGLLFSAFLIYIPLVGALLVLGAAIGVIVVGILKLVYLYRTAKAFRDY